MNRRENETFEMVTRTGEFLTTNVDRFPKASAATEIAAALEARVLEFKKQIVKEAMDEARGNFVDAARIMDITANYLRKLYRNLGMA